MRNRLVRIIILGIIVVAVGGAFIAAYTADDSPFGVGEPAPNFTLVSLDGEQVSLEDFRGQGVMLNFWATNCPPCREEMPAMERQYQQFKDKGVHIVAVNIAESRLVASRFKDRYELTFPILLDEDRSVTQRYGVILIPTSFFIDKDGNVVAKVERMMTDEMIKAHLEAIVP